MATYLIDIDGVICTKGHGGKYSEARPIKDNIKIVNKLHNLRHVIILYTARTQSPVMRFDQLTKENSIENMKGLTIMQLKDWEVQYDDINWTKPDSDYIVDDKCITLDEAMKV